MNPKETVKHTPSEIKEPPQKSNVPETLMSEPESAEKYLMIIQHKIDEITKTGAGGAPEKWEFWLGNLERCLIFEKENTDPIIQNLDNLGRGLNKSDWRESRKCIASIMKSIRPVDATQIRRLELKAREHSKMIEGKDVILIMGMSGTGKSTTIHYLLGTPMKETKQGNIINIEPDMSSIKNEDLKLVKINHGMESETSTLTPIRSVYNKKEIILCDSPGYVDSHGAESDIANAVGVVGGLTKCSGVLPVVVVNRKLGDRAATFVSLSKLLQTIIGKQNIKYVTYLVTKSDSKEDQGRFIDELDNMLMEVTFKISMEETEESLFLQELLTDISNKKNDPKSFNFIDLRDKKGGSMILENILKKTEKISDPKNEIRPGIAPEAVGLAKDQVEKYKTKMSIVLKALDNFPLFNKCLEKSEYIVRCLSLPDYTANYKNYLINLSNEVNERLRASAELVGDLALPRALIKPELVEFRDCHTLVRGLAGTKKKLFDVQESPERFDGILNSKLKHVLDSLKNFEWRNPRISLLMEELKILGEVFPEKAGDMYTKKCTNIEKYLQELRKNAFNHIENNEIDRVCDLLMVFKNARNALRTHLKDEFFEKTIVEITEKIKTKLNTVYKMALEKLHPQFLTEEAFEFVREKGEVIWLYSNQSRLNEFFPSEEVSKYYSNLVTEIEKLHNTLCQQLKKSLEEKRLDNVTRTFNSLKSLRLHIPRVINQNTVEEYESVRVKIEETQQNIDLLAQRATTAFDKHIEDFFQKYIVEVRSIKKYEWLAEIAPDAMNSCFYTIESNLMKSLDKMKKRFLRLEIDLDNSINMQDVLEIMNILEDSQVMHREFPMLGRRATEIEKTIIDNVRIELESIRAIIRRSSGNSRKFEPSPSRNSTLNSSKVFQTQSSTSGGFLGLFKKSTVLKTETDLASEYNLGESRASLFDPKRFDRAREYLDYARQIPNFETSQLAREIQRELNEFMGGYYDNVEKEFKRNWSIIMQCQQSEQNQAQTQISLSELESLLEKNSASKDKNMVELKKNMVKVLQGRFLELQKSLDDVAQTNYNLHIVVRNANQLSVLDKYCDGFSFSELEGRTKLFIEKTDFQRENEVMMLLEKEEYKEVAKRLDRLKPEDPNKEKMIKKIMIFVDGLKKQNMFQPGNKANTRISVQILLKVMSYLAGMQRDLSNKLPMGLVQDIGALSITNKTYVNKAMESYLAISLADWQSQNFSEAFKILDELLMDIGVLQGPLIDEYLEWERRIEINRTEMRTSLKRSFTQNIVNEKYVTGVMRKIDKQEEFTQLTAELKRTLREEIPTRLYQMRESVGEQEEQGTHQRRIKSKAPPDYRELRKQLENLKNCALLLDDHQQEELEEEFEKTERFISDQNKKAIDDIAESFKNRKKGSEKMSLAKYEELMKSSDQSSLDLLNKKIMNQWVELKAKIDELMAKEMLLDALNLAKENMPLYKRLGQYIPELVQEHGELNNKINKRLSMNIHGISEADDPKNAEKYLKVTLLPLARFRDNMVTDETRDTSDTTLKFIGDEEFYQQLKDAFDTLSGLFKRLDENFMNSLNDLDIKRLKQSLDAKKKWDSILVLLMKESLDEFFILEFRTYSDTTAELQERLSFMLIEIQNIRLGEDYKKVEGKKEREELYQKLNNQLTRLKNMKDVFQELKDVVDASQFNIPQIEKDVIYQISYFWETWSEQVKFVIDRNPDTLIRHDFNKLTRFYDHCSTFDKEVNAVSKQVNTQQRIEYVLDTLMKKLRERQRNAIEPKQVAEYLIITKNISVNLYFMKNKLDALIDEFLAKIKKEDSKMSGKLSALLEDDRTGALIIEEHAFFKLASISIFNKSIENANFDFIMKKVAADSQNSHFDRSGLEKAHQEYTKTYTETVKLYMGKFIKAEKISADEILQDLISSILSDFEPPMKNALVWDKTFKAKLPTIIAKIGALWTLKNSEYLVGEGKEGNTSELLQPHPGQLLALFRILGIGYKIDLKEGLENNLIEIGTGEGKSLILAITSIIFALAGAQVYCACYSSYLSKRDERAFENLFSTLNVKGKIAYGTFNQLCEGIINEQGNIRERIMNMIFDIKAGQINSMNSNKVLLIDEVDVFFSKDFYGSNYFISAPIRDPTVSDLIQYIWDNKHNRLTLAKLKKEKVYANICGRFSGWEAVIDESIKDMLADVKDYNYDYIIQDGKIGVQEHSQVVFNRVSGYKTAFVHFKEYEASKINQASLNAALFLNFKCGNFSYAEIALRFNRIIGVTGTLKELSQIQNQLIENYYKIKLKTFIPSVFGDTKRKFAKIADVVVENDPELFLATLTERIKNRLAEKRAVLVFFETMEDLIAYKNSERAKTISENCSVLSDKTDESLRDTIIKTAANSGSVTLITKEMGRGVDFICRDQEVLRNGGVQVIQTFFSEEKTEEIQIMGRCGRQGQPGAYCIILFNKALEKFLTSKTYLEEIKEFQAKDRLYDKLCEKRELRFNEIFTSIETGVKAMKDVHDQSVKLVEALFKEERSAVIEILKIFNVGKLEEIQSRTLILLDGTESMDLLMEKVKNNLHITFDRAAKILKEKKLRPDSFQLQICVFRDYDCDVEEILQVSSWESNPDELKRFMDTVDVFGGDDFEEAIEIGLWHANQENNREKISQIILIGDAPAKPKDAILKSRKDFGGEDLWKNSKYGPPTYYDDELKKLKDVPIHSFYLDKPAKINFDEISKKTKGKSQEFNLEKMSIADMLTQNILNSFGKDLAQAYIKSFGGVSYI